MNTVIIVAAAAAPGLLSAHLALRWRSRWVVAHQGRDHEALSALGLALLAFGGWPVLLPIIFFQKALLRFIVWLDAKLDRLYRAAPSPEQPEGTYRE